MKEKILTMHTAQTSDACQARPYARGAGSQTTYHTQTDFKLGSQYDDNLSFRSFRIVSFCCLNV